MKSENYIRPQALYMSYRGDYLCSYDAVYSNVNTKTTKTQQIISRHGAKKSNLAEHPNFSSLYDSVKRASGVSLLVFNSTFDKVLLALEYRMSIARHTIGFVQGVSEPNELPEETAKRELLEETGCNLDSIIKIMQPAYTAPSFTDDATSLIICTTKDDNMETINSVLVTAQKMGSFEEIIPLWLDKEQVRSLLNGKKPNHPYWENRRFEPIPFNIRAEMFALAWTTDFSPSRL